MIQIFIDPDTKKHGVCVKSDGVIISAKALNSFDLYDLIKDIADEVIIDAGWLNPPSSFNFKSGQNAKLRQKIAMNVGMNHQAGKTVEVFCVHSNIACKLHQPTKKKLSGSMVDRLLKSGYHKYELDTKNQDIIDAVALALIWK